MHSQQEQGPHRVQHTPHPSKETQQAAQAEGPAETDSRGGCAWLTGWCWCRSLGPDPLQPTSSPNSPLLPPLPKSHIPLPPRLSRAVVRLVFSSFQKMFFGDKELVTGRRSKQTKFYLNIHPQSTFCPDSWPNAPSQSKDGALLIKRDTLSRCHGIRVLQWPWGSGPDGRLCQSEGLLLSRQWARC